MAETENKKTAPPAGGPVEQEEPSLFSQVGTFPYIILKIIQLITPDCLITKKPPKKDYRI